MTLHSPNYHYGKFCTHCLFVYLLVQITYMQFSGGFWKKERWIIVCEGKIDVNGKVYFKTVPNKLSFHPEIVNIRRNFSRAQNRVEGIDWF